MKRFLPFRRVRTERECLLRHKSWQPYYRYQRSRCLTAQGVSGYRTAQKRLKLRQLNKLKRPGRTRVIAFCRSSGELFEAKRRGENTAALSTVSPLTRELLSEMRSASSREAADAQIISIINPKTRRNPRVLRRGLQNMTFVGAWFLL